MICFDYFQVVLTLHKSIFLRGGNTLALRIVALPHKIRLKFNIRPVHNNDSLFRPINIEIIP